MVIRNFVMANKPVQASVMHHQSLYSADAEADDIISKSFKNNSINISGETSGGQT